MGRLAIYPGSFDPITNGHLDIVQRGLACFGRLRVGVATNPGKKALVTTEEKLELIRLSVGDDPRIEIDAFDGLLVDYAERVGAHAILRGLRAVADFEYEFQMAHMNHFLRPSVETVFLMTGPESFYVSSSLVKEVASHGKDVSALVPPPVAAALARKFGAP